MRALALIVLLVVPTATSWGIQGSVEPDTADDRAGGFMPQGAPPDDGPPRVYFNAVATWGLGSPAGLHHPAANPNVAPSTLAPPAPIQLEAYLGIWRDCDGDGYVGMARTTLWQYRAELLLDGGRCPDGTRHNRDGWVLEFVPIGPPSTGPAYERMMNDTGANVWADFGRPGAPLPASCRMTPVPNGTFQSSGSLLAWADCADQGAVAQRIEELDAQTRMGLGFADPDRPEQGCGGALSIELRLWSADGCTGKPGRLQAHSGRPAARVWDCDGEHARVRDPTAEEGPGVPNEVVVDRFTFHFTNADGDYASFAPLAAAGGKEWLDPEGSLLDAGGQLGWGWSIWTVDSRCGRPSVVQYGNQSAWVEEAPARLREDGPRRATDFPMDYTVDRENGNVRIDGERHPAHMPVIAGSATAARHATGSGWSSRATYAPPAYYGGVTRGDLSPAGPLWITAYARLGAATLQDAATPGIVGFYGSEACGAALSGELAGWDRDRSHWWNPAYVATRPPPDLVAAVVGDPFHLRDVDCYDGRVTPDGAAKASLADVSGEPPCE